MGQWDNFRQTVWERDKGICGICGEPVDPDRWDMDHTIPRIGDGPDELHNLRVTHMGCNRRKGYEDRTGRTIGVNKKPVNLRLWPDLLERVQRLAERKNRSVTWVVERALEEYCEREGHPTPAPTD